MSESMASLRRIDRLSDVDGQYDVLFCDVWGVVHNGEVKSPAAEAALTAARNQGVKVVLLTNSPRTSEAVAQQLGVLNFSRSAYDAIVTSGDATRALIKSGPRKLFHLGPERDIDLFAGLDVELVQADEAQSIAATGLFHDERETPEDYADLLAGFAARGLDMVCANPDIVVHRGERLIYCAGALAQSYSALGGKVFLAGKPHAPIYELAARVADAAGKRILCIGDGLFTDIAGANGFGADALLVIRGIHEVELQDVAMEAGPLTDALRQRGLVAQYAIESLR
ncbi:TIGR01459 family HAD-type hydrolase [Aureimonas fodinaquatilis]|uniref:TIGR01459 family HAD-type hydrolase n=1 Tax=Aureimonas fodinaquatilis TaxID=2565783 RepID=A0A5B0E1M6_9HYPH|nr:TIGR01459 family HAD-type hydrolase [Aureimonas fodinaquatilis]KAA0972202.1 TIGR01459 family HAD-type hydrolase [Aureimonas fodinaquatilis]